MSRAIVMTSCSCDNLLKTCSRHSSMDGQRGRGLSGVGQLCIVTQQAAADSGAPRQRGGAAPETRLSCRSVLRCVFAIELVVQRLVDKALAFAERRDQRRVFIEAAI